MIAEKTFDINEARLAHLRWEMALKNLVAGTTQTLDGHENCPLGIWLCGEAEHQHGDNNTFRVLKVAHKQFHTLVSGFIDNSNPHNSFNSSEYIDKIEHVSQQVLFLLTYIELSHIKMLGHGKPKTFGGFIGNNRHQDDLITNNLATSVGQARLTHLKWLNELQEALNVGKGLCNIQSANDCALGLWLRHNMTADHGFSLGLEALDTAHMNFHQSIEDTIAALHRNDYQVGDYTYSRAYDYSSAVIKQLTMLELLIGDIST